MSIRVMNYVWSDSPAKGSELLILLAIADFANDEGVAWPGVETLAKKARLSRRQTQYNIRSLVEAGLLTVEENAGPHGTHLYRINLDPMGDANIAPVQNVHRAKSARGGAKSAPQGVQPIAPEPSIEPPIEPSTTNTAQRKPKRIAYSDEFERFWAAYPKGHGVKKVAYDEWQKIAPDDEMVEEIMAGLEAWKQCGRWLRGYVKDAERFVKHHMWESDPPTDDVQPTNVTPFKNSQQNNNGYSSSELIRRGLEGMNR